MSQWKRSLVAIFLVFSMLMMPLTVNIALARQVQLSFGQSVVLLVTERIHPSTHQVGQTVLLSVQSDVVIDGVVVIAAGTPAMAEVSRSVPMGSVGKPAEIGIDVLSTTAIDGTMVPLRGSKVVVGENKQTQSLIFTLLCCILALMMKGTDAEIMDGSVVRADVYGSLMIEVP